MDLQGHGRTADVPERQLSLRQHAEDTRWEALFKNFLAPDFCGAEKAQVDSKLFPGCIYLEQREDALLDELLAKQIDQTIFERPRRRTRDQRMEYERILTESRIAVGDAALGIAKRVLELSTRVKELWYSRSPLERRELVDKLLSNPVLDGPTVQFELKKPFAVLAEMKRSEEWRTLVPLYRNFFLQVSAGLANDFAKLLGVSVA